MVESGMMSGSSVRMAAMSEAPMDPPITEVPVDLFNDEGTFAIGASDDPFPPIRFVRSTDGREIVLLPVADGVVGKGAYGRIVRYVDSGGTEYMVKIEAPQPPTRCAKADAVGDG